MRRHIIAGIVIALLAMAESSLLPATLGGTLRLNLVLLVSAIWVALRGNEGLLWAMGGGLLLDLQSGAPFGVHMVGLMLGNSLAVLLDQVPIPIPIVRSLNWVFVTTVTYHTTALTVLALTGRTFEFSIGFTNVMLPSLIANLILAIPVHIVLTRLRTRLREAERFLPER